MAIIIVVVIIFIVTITITVTMTMAASIHCHGPWVVAGTAAAVLRLSCSAAAVVLRRRFLRNDGHFAS